MNTRSRILTQGAIIAALYAVLTHAQNLLLPGSATWAIQLRVSECMCILALFTPSAVWGLGVGCFLFNILYAGALAKHNVPFELHIYPFGCHGLSTSDGVTNDNVNEKIAHTQSWTYEAKKWLKLMGFEIKK